MLALMSLPALARDKNGFRSDLPPPLPEPNPLETEVPRGGPVWITLSAYSLTSPIIRYRIRRKPEGGQAGVTAQGGQIGTPQMATADTAVVKYTPPAGAGPGTDSFEYEVQSDAGVSAPAEVRIKITDKDPVLVAPEAIDFGEALPGETVKRLLLLQNIGGGLVEGRIRMPEGWTVDGDAAYRLGAGAKQSFTLVFKPLEERKYTGDVEYTGNPDRATDLDGKGVGPITVTEGPVELKEAGSVRMGTIQVANRTNAARTLRVTAGPRLEADASVDAPAKGVAEIVVRAKPGEKGELQDHVTVEGEGVKADIPVHAAAMPGQSPAVIAQRVMVTGSAESPTRAEPVSAPIQAGADAPGNALLAEMTLPPPVRDLGDSAASEGRMPVMALKVERVGEHEARVSCDFKAVAPAQTYSLEAQTVRLDANGRPEAIWQPFARAAVQANGQSVSAEMAHLLPNALYVVRLVGVDEQGKVVALSSSVQVWTVRPQSGGRWGWVAVGVAVLAGVGVWMRGKRRR